MFANEVVFTLCVTFANEVVFTLLQIKKCAATKCVPDMFEA